MPDPFAAGPAFRRRGLPALVVLHLAVLAGPDAPRAASPEAKTGHDPFGVQAVDAAVQDPAPTTVADPLVGWLRTCGRSYCDDTGPRTVFFTSWFPALAVARADWEAFTFEIDSIAAAGWQGIRMFHAIGGWHSFFGRMEVLPFAGTIERDGHRKEGWSDYDAVLRRVLQACRDRNLKVALTYAGQWYDETPERIRAHHRRVALIAAEFGDTVVRWEAWNEGAINGGDPALGARILADIKQILPRVLTVNSDCTGAEAESWNCHVRWSQGADLVGVHGTREPMSAALQRAFELAAGWAHAPTHPRPYDQSEPVGDDAPGEREVFAHTSDAQNPGWLTGLYLMHIVSGQATTYFSGPGVRHGPANDTPLGTTWGFHRLPAILRLVPRDIGQWPHLMDGHHDEAVLTFHAASDERDTPMRIDQVRSRDRVAALVYGGEGQWHVTSRRALRYQIIGPAEVEAEGVLEPGQTIPGLHAGLGARLVLGSFQ